MFLFKSQLQEEEASGEEEESGGEEDGFFVPHGYLSDDEGIREEDDDDEVRRKYLSKILQQKAFGFTSNFKLKVFFICLKTYDFESFSQ